MSIDQGPFRGHLADFEKIALADDRAAVEQEVENRTRHIRGEIEEGLRHNLQQYSGLEYVDENNHEIKQLPPEVRDHERKTRNAPARIVIKALVFCQKNPRINGEALKKMKDTKFRGWPIHIDIGVLPDLVRYGQTFMRIAAIQKLLDADPEPENEDSLMSPARQDVIGDVDTGAGVEETGIVDE